MNPRGGKHLPPAASNHAPFGEPEPFRLLDLPAEIRFMIYGYVLGFHNSRWRLTIDLSPRYVLELCDAHGTKSHRSISLLQTCRSISLEALPILYDQTQFDILFSTNMKPGGHSGYILRLPPSLSRSDQSLLSAVLKRVKHLRFFFLMDKLWMYMCFSLLPILGRYVEGQLRSLRFVFNSLSFMNVLSNTYYTAHTLGYLPYHGNANLEFLDNDPTEEHIDRFKESLKLTGSTFSISAIKKSDVLSCEKDWWAEFAN